MNKKMINTKARIYCHSCKKDFDIYFTGLSRVECCHNCGAKIDETMWKSIFESIAHVQDTNQHFYKYNLERNEPMFTISVEGLCTDFKGE